VIVVLTWAPSLLGTVIQLFVLAFAIVINLKMKDDLSWKMTLNGRHLPMEDDLQLKTTSNGRQPPMEETFNGKRPPMEENH